MEKLEHLISCMEGVMHIGQRNLFRVRVSKEAFEKGLRRLKDFGEVIYGMLMSDLEPW